MRRTGRRSNRANSEMSTTENNTESPSTTDSVVEIDPSGSAAGVARAVAASVLRQVGFFFKNPAKLFRPKMQTFQGAKMRHRHHHMDEHSNALKALRTLVRDEGYRGLLRTLTPPLVYNAVTGTILFSTYQSMYHYLYKQHRVKDTARVQSRDLYRHLAWTNLLSGAVAGTLHAVVASPFEAARAHNSHSHKSFDYVNSARALLQHHGTASLLRGMGLVVPRDALGFGSFFAIYKVMKKEFSWLLPDEWGKLKGATGVLLAGGFGGMAYQLIAHPFEQIQHVYMTEHHSKFLFHSYRHTISHIVKTEGWNYFYRGVGARLKRAFSPAAVGFLIYEVTLKHRLPSTLD